MGHSVYFIVYGCATGGANRASSDPRLSENAAPFSEVKREEIVDRLVRCWFTRWRHY